MKLLISLIIRAPLALICVALVSALLFSPEHGLAETKDEQTQAHELALTRAREAKEVPAQIRELKFRKLSSYQSKKDLVRDAVKINDYFESGDASAKERAQFSKFIESSVKSAELTNLSGDQTLEQFVLKTRVDFIAEKPEAFSKLKELLAGAHLKGLSRIGALAVLGYVTHVILGHISYTRDVEFAVGGFILGTLRTGPASQIMNVATGWFLTPTTEMIKVFNSRYTGKIEERINRFYDRFKPKQKAEASDRNERPKIANVDEDGTDFAGMSEEAQMKNWDKSMAMWVAVAKRYGQLLRDTHHSGRFLMLMSWTDEQAASALIETVATKMISLDVWTKVALNPYETSFLIKGETDKQAKLDSLVQEYKELCKSMWSRPDATAADLDRATAGLERVTKELRDLGLTDETLRVLSEAEETRAKAIGTIVTAAALNEMRLFSSAEANRNLADGARKAQRAIRFGLNLQEYTDNFEELVRHQIRLMGYDHEGRTCIDLLS